MRSPSPYQLAALALSLARLALSARFELSPDEAYYLTWASGAAGPDHPPLIGWLARGALALHLGPLELSARLVPVACALASTLALDALLGHLDAPPRARSALIVMTLLPLPATGALLLTPDAPLTAIESVALFAALSPKVSERARAVILTLCAPLALLAKVSALMLVPALVAAIKPRARWWISMALAQCIALPLAAPSLLFQLQHAFTASGPIEGLAATPPFLFAGVAIFASGQLGLVLPAIGLAARLPKSATERALATFIAVQVSPVLLSSLVRVPEPSWTAPAWPALLVYLGLGAASAKTSTLRASIALTIAAALALHLHALRPFLPIAPERDQSARLHGWKRWVCDGGSLPVRGLPDYATRAELQVYRPLCALRP